MVIRAVLCLGLASTLFACGKSESNGSDSGDRNGGYQVKDQVAQGSIGGQTWSFRSGRAKPDPFKSGSLAFDLWDIEVSDPCNDFTFPNRSILFSLPAASGDYPMSLERTFTFYSNDNGANRNFVATSGQINLLIAPTGIGVTRIDGEIVGSFDSANNVNGRFSVPLCP